MKKPIAVLRRLTEKLGLPAAGMRSITALAAMAVACAPASSALAASGDGDALPAWSKGYFYIHHISTGRGNSTYLVFPDGTTMLIDAGEADPKFAEIVKPLKAFPPLPDGEHSAAY